MTKPSQRIAILLSALVLSTGLLSTAAMAADDAVAQGKALAFDRKKGNCLGCHAIEGGELPGNIGPPLIAMKARFPDKKKLYDQIWDATANNPMTAMPPFGKHGALTDKQVELITEYIHTL